MKYLIAIKKSVFKFFYLVWFDFEKVGKSEIRAVFTTTKKSNNI